MTSNEYNVSGIRGGIASAQNARAMAHLAIDIGGHSKVYSISERIAKKAAMCKAPLSAERPCIWTLEPKHVQLRGLIVAKLNNSDGLYAEPQGLDKIAIIGQPEYRLV